MASSSSDSSFADEFYAHLNLEEQQGRVEFMEYDNDVGEEEVIESPLCVEGRLLKEKPMNFVAFKQTMAAMWRPVKGMLVKDCWSERAFKDVGNFIGRYIESDQRNYSLIWRDYMRIKVTMDGNGSGWILSMRGYLHSAFFCGHLGHSDRFCAKLLEHPEVPRSQFAYGP
ncbi:hypothetical protein P3X46_018792 [Hevea brasiliensis]|uniref:DUF4283 domain-containing protein n=1 Tax=Hevea brasiliensis TaxID=3981 RepID=A0ABQ9LRS0_HEVBR|nr:hypothetical protein P3X46_018792 [Hevea brasiliensis]